MKKIFVIVETKKGIFIEVENDVLTSVYQLQKENVPIFGKSAELPDIQSDLINRFGKVDEVYVFAKDKLYATQFCSKDEDVKIKLDEIISKMKGTNLTNNDFMHRTYFFKNTYLNSIFKTNNINSLKNFFKDLGWGEIKFLGPLELFLFINNVEQYKKSVLMPLSNGFILYDNKKIFLSNKENLELLSKGIDEIFVTYPDPLFDNNISFNEVKKIIPNIKQGRPWLTLKGVKTKPVDGIEWGYLIYYFENSSSWREEFNFVKDTKRKMSLNPEIDKNTEKNLVDKKVSLITSGDNNQKKGEYKTPTKLVQNKELKKGMFSKISKENKLESRSKSFSNLAPISKNKNENNFSLKSIGISVFILIFIIIITALLPKFLPYKNRTINLENISLESILKNQDTKILFKGENEFSDGKFYVLNDGSKDIGTFIDKDAALKEASAIGLQISIFEVEKSNGIEINRIPLAR